VDFEDDVWVHRVAVGILPGFEGHPLHDDLFFMMTVYRESLRIHRDLRPASLLQSPLWMNRRALTAGLEHDYANVLKDFVADIDKTPEDVTREFVTLLRQCPGIAERDASRLAEYMISYDMAGQKVLYPEQAYTRTLLWRLLKKGKNFCGRYFPRLFQLTARFHPVARKLAMRLVRRCI
jgi:hypothetical protein